MANNRMFMVCSLCKDKYVLAKYYPSTGYYCKHNTNETLDAFFDEHRHGERSFTGGNPFIIEYEVQDV